MPVRLCVVGCIAGLLLAGCAGSSGSPPISGGPGCLPPRVQLLGHGVGTVAGSPTISVAAGHRVRMAVQANQWATITEVVLAVARPGTTPGVGAGADPLEDPSVVFAQERSRPGSHRVVMVFQPSSSGTLPVLSRVTYRVTSSDCTGRGDQAGVGQTERVIAYLEVGRS
jgi:hypothetical protein